MKSNLRLATDAGEPVRSRWPRWRPRRHQVVGTTIAASAAAIFVWYVASLPPEKQGWALLAVVLVGVASVWIAVRNWMMRASIPPDAQVIVHVHKNW